MNNIVEQVKELRGKTGIGMMECKRALVEVDGDIDKAITLLRKQGMKRPDQLAGRTASEGVIYNYTHGNKIGVMLELRCETDFASKSKLFTELAKNIAMHIVASKPIYISKDDVPTHILLKESNIIEDQIDESIPKNIVEKIMIGRMNKFRDDVCLLEQSWIRDKSLTIAQLINNTSNLLNEKVELVWFMRRQLGE